MMNNKWLQIVVFSLLFGAVGLLLGRSCNSCGGGGCSKGEVHCAKNEGGMGACGHKACDHKGCTGGGGKCAHGGDRHGHHGAGDHAGMHATIMGIDNSDFEGDTTFTEGNSTVTIRKMDGKMEVNVQKEEKQAAAAEEAK